MLLLFLWSVFVIENVQPGLGHANLHPGLEHGAAGVRVAKAARLLVVVDGVHRRPVLVAGPKVRGRDARGRDLGHLALGATPLVLDVEQPPAKALLDHPVASNLQRLPSADTLDFLGRSAIHVLRTNNS